MQHKLDLNLDGCINRQRKLNFSARVWEEVPTGSRIQCSGFEQHVCCHVTLRQIVRSAPQSLPGGNPQGAYEEANKEENKEKNRYPNILPCESFCSVQFFFWVQTRRSPLPVYICILFIFWPLNYNKMFHESWHALTVTEQYSNSFLSCLFTPLSHAFTQLPVSVVCRDVICLLNILCS